MSASQKSDLTNARRSQILEATARVISRRGAERTRLVDVAHSAGVSIGLIQHYFKTRDALLAATFVFFNDAFIGDWEATAETEDDPARRLLSLLRLSVFERDAWRDIAWPIWIEFWSLCSRDKTFRNQYSSIYKKWREPFNDAIIEGMATGQFRSTSTSEDIVDRLTAQIEGLRVRALLEPERMPRVRMFESVVRTAEQELNCLLDTPAAAPVSG
ncbi:MAG: TetR/AcrR family transcriptional regulator [Candidatus Binatia bacterium]